MQEHLDEIRSDVKEIKTAVGQISIDVAKNTLSLDHHIQRTEANERRIQQVETWLLGLLAAILAAIVTSHFIS